MNIAYIPVLTLAACLLAPATAQEMLVVKTANEDIAEAVVDAFEGDSLPELGEGKHFVFTVDKDGKLAVTTASGSVGMLSLRAKPALLAEHYAEQIGEVQQQAGMMTAMMAGQMGMPPKDLNDLVADILAFPMQLDALAVDVAGSTKDGFDVNIDCTPTTKGWFAEFVAAVKPNAKGAPRLSVKNALLSASVNCEPALMLRTMKPFLGFAVGAAATDKEERQKFAGLIQEMVTLMDGTMAIAIDPDQGMRSVAGVLDGAKMLSLLDSADYKKLVKAAAEGNPMAESEITEKALVHRDVTFTKQVTETGQDTPMSPNGVVTAFNGIAGSFALASGSEATAKELTDLVLDQKLERAPLTNGAVAELSVRLAEMVEGLSGGMAQMDGAPQTASLTLGQNNGKLNVKVKLAF